MTSPFTRFKNGEQVTEALFLAMCKDHDLTYAMSDDRRAYNAGRETAGLIDKAAVQLGKVKAASIWNMAVDEKVLSDYRAMYYWNSPSTQGETA